VRDGFSNPRVGGSSPSTPAIFSTSYAGDHLPGHLNFHQTFIILSWTSACFLKYLLSRWPASSMSRLETML